MSRTAGTDLLSFCSSFSRLARRREIVSSCEVGFVGVLGTPIQSELPVRRYERRRRRASRSSIVAPATVSLSTVIVVFGGVISGVLSWSVLKLRVGLLMFG